MMGPLLRVAACHASPVLLSARDTTQKCISLIHRASQSGANLVVFPESYIPAFPVWSAILPPTKNHDFFRRMAVESVYADGEEIRAIRNTAKQTRTVVSLGISEKVHFSCATLFNTNLIIGSDGEIAVHHRKLMPTFFEKLTWSPGDGNGLRVATTEYGKIGTLICGENTNPLARYAMMAQGEQVHISTWPAIWPTRVPKVNTPTSTIPGGVTTEDKGPYNDTKDSTTGNTLQFRGVNYDNVAANRTRAAAHSFEAKCFGVLCASHLDEATIKAMSSLSEDAESMKDIMERSPRAASMFLDPTGALLPAWSVDPESGERRSKDLLQHDEGILYADMDLDDCIEGKQYHDVVGGYQRLDVFDLKIDRSRREPASFVDGCP